MPSQGANSLYFRICRCQRTCLDLPCLAARSLHYKILLIACISGIVVVCPIAETAHWLKCCRPIEICACAPRLQQFCHMGKHRMICLGGENILLCNHPAKGVVTCNMPCRNKFIRIPRQNKCARHHHRMAQAGSSVDIFPAKAANKARMKRWTRQARCAANHMKKIAFGGH